MGPTLEALHRLQQIQAGILEIQRDLASKERAVHLQKRRAAQLQKQLEQKQQEIRLHEAEVARAELDLRAKEQQIAKLRLLLNTVKTNKEYSAVLTQLNTEKVDYSKMEEGALLRMSGVDQHKAELASIQAQHAQVQAKVDELQKIHEATVERQREPLSRLQAQRDQAAADVPPTALAAFERVAEHQDGEAMAPVIQPNRRRSEYICGGCNMAITVEQVNGLLTRDDLQICNNCGRILFVEVPEGQRASS